MFLLAIFWGGSINLFTAQLPDAISRLILQERLLQSSTAALVGASLALCGLLYQKILFNPLAEPYLLGVSAGGALGGVAALFYGLEAIFIPSMAGALLAFLLVLGSAALGKNGAGDSNSLVLFGVVINAFCSSLIMLLVSLGGNRVNSMLFWLMGSVSHSEVIQLVYISALLFSLTFAALLLHRSLDALALGEEQAQYQGVDTRRLKIFFCLFSSLLTAIVVASVGIIGFVGLLVPHLARLLSGENTLRLIPLSLVIGATFLTTAHLLSVTMLGSTIIPIGVLCGLIGFPAFFIIYKNCN